jgi:hypothetical protein
MKPGGEDRVLLLATTLKADRRSRRPLPLAAPASRPGQDKTRQDRLTLPQYKEYRGMQYRRGVTRTRMALAGGDRDIDLYHWSTPRFSSLWQDTLSALVARGRARVSVSASAANWPERIRGMQYVDHDDFAAAH